VPSDLLCFSHLRWDFVYQRPNHLMARAARDRRVFFVEEPVYRDTPTPTLEFVAREEVTVVTPIIPAADAAKETAVLRRLMDDLEVSPRPEGGNVLRMVKRFSVTVAPS